MADRSVSINLRARVAGFVAGMGQAKKETTDLGRKMTETGASADRMRQRLEAATRALPKIEIDADSSPAEIKFAQLRAQLESLADKKIGVDVDADAARAQLAEIERELEQLQRNEANINVRADIGTALSELRAIDGEISRVDGRTANVSVNADVAGALRGIALVGAALAALPAMTTIGVGVAGLGAAFAAAGAGAGLFAAVAVPGISRVTEAMKAAESATKGAGGATAGAGQSAARSAIQAMQLEAAEKKVVEAKKEAKAAEEDLTRAREAGRRALEDMNFSLERSILSQKDAALAVEETAARLAEIMADPEATDLERRRAELSHEQAMQRLEEQSVKTKRQKKDTAEANKAGVEGTKEYQRAQENLVRAQEKVADAQRQLTQLQLQQNAAMSSGGGGGGAGGLTDAFAKLSKQEKALVKDMQSFKDAYLDWQRSLQGDVFPVISQGLGLMEKTLPKLTPLVKSSSAAFSVLLKDAEAALAGPFWNTFLFNVNTQMPNAIIGLGRSFGNVATGVAGVIDAFLPFAPTVVGGVEDATKAFSEWGQQLKDSPEFHEFILFVQQNAPAVWELIKNVAKAIGNVAESVVPLGVGSMAGLNLLAQIVAGMDPQHIQLIALAIIAIKTAQAGLKVASFFTDMPGKLDRMRDGFDRVKGKAGELGSAVGGLGDKLGGLGSIVGGAALAGGLLILGDRLAANAEAADRFAEKARAMGGGNLDQEIAAVTKALEEQRAQVGFAILDTIYFSDAEREAADKVEALEGRLAELKHQKELDAIASKAAGDAAGEHGRKVGELNGALDTFASRTDALAALRAMEQAHRTAAAAIDASNGKLSISRGMTDQQRDAVVRAREAFSGYITTIKTAADGAATLSGKQTDGTRVILEQLPKLAELAGKNGEARQQILLLAQAYGISEADARKAMSGAKGLKDVLAELKSKQIKIEADTAQAEAKLKNLANYLEILKGRAALAIGGNLNPTSARGNAWGGIQHRDGRPDYMAQGGIRNLGASAPAMIARQPYRLSGRSGPDVIFGEAGWEAFIPLDPSKRQRGLQVLGETASAMGMAVVPQDVSAASGAAGASFTGGGGSLGGTMVTVTGITALQSSIDTTAAGLTSSLGGASAGLDAAFGDAGAFTGVVDAFSESVTGWADTVAGEVPPLTDAVTALGEAVSAAAEAAGGDAKGGGGSKGDERNPRSSSKGKAGSKGKALSAVKSTKPLTEPKVGIVGAAGHAASGGGTNWSKVSKPVQSSYSGSSGGSSGSSSGGGGETIGGSQRAGGSLVQVGTLAVTKEADVDLVAAALYARLGSKG